MAVAGTPATPYRGLLCLCAGDRRHRRQPPAWILRTRSSASTGFARAVSGAETGDPAFRKAHDIRLSLGITQVTHRHCVDLTRAFIQDATKLRYADWNDLIGSCDLSAAPVGRFLVDLHGESKTAYPACDALCNALQVLNHLQDCGDDYNALNRVYLPQNWMAAAGARVEALGRKSSSPALRRVLDRCLEATEELLESADRLPVQFRSFRLAMETAVILAIARKLGKELRRRDPLAERVVLTKAQYVACCLRGIGRTPAPESQAPGAPGNETRAGGSTLHRLPGMREFPAGVPRA